MLNRTLTGAAIGIALIASPAMAGKAHTQSLQIEYSDLNLNSVEGQARLEDRIDAAAKKVCKLNEQRTGTRLRSNERRECFAKAKKSARNQMAVTIQETQKGG